MPSSVLVAGPKIDIVAQPVIKPILSLNDNNRFSFQFSKSLLKRTKISWTSLDDPLSSTRSYLSSNLKNNSNSS